MKITVIGKGQVGKALAASLSRADHEVVFGTRAPSSADEAAIAVAAEAADIVILAVPSAAIGEVVSAAGGLAGKIVIDATNPIAMTEDGPGLALGFTTSGAEIGRAHV